MKAYSSKFHIGDRVVLGHVWEDFMLVGTVTGFCFNRHGAVCCVVDFEDAMKCRRYGFSNTWLEDYCVLIESRVDMPQPENICMLF